MALKPSRFVWQPGDVTVTKAKRSVKLSRYGLKVEPLKGPLVRPVRSGGELLALTGWTDASREAALEARQRNGPPPKTPRDLANRVTRQSPAFQERHDAVVAKVNAQLEAKQDTQNVEDRVQGKVGVYNPERESQQRVLDQAYLHPEGVTIAQNHEMLIMGGLPGSGKTTWLSNPDNIALLRGFDPKTAVGINSDELKQNTTGDGKPDMKSLNMVPDYPGLQPNEVTGLIHEESADIAGRINYEAQKAGDNVVLDLTLKNAGQFERKVSGLSQATGNKYKTTMVFIDTDPATSADRVAARYSAGGTYTGRFVPTTNSSDVPIGDDGRTENRAAFDSLRQSPEVDRAILVSSDGKTILSDTGSREAGNWHDDYAST